MNNISEPPLPPEPPPSRMFKEVLFFGLIETQESKQLTKEWRINMKKWRLKR